MLPCPVPRVAFADGESVDGQPRRRRRRKCVDNEVEQREISKATASSEGESSDEGESAILAGLQSSKPKRECPVPKPGGLVGELLGFKPDGGDGEGSKPP